MGHRTIVGDCLRVLRNMPDNSVDLILCSPPYEAQRTYNIDFNLRGQDWVDWAFARYMECVRVSRGLVAWVIEGATTDFRWSATPILLAADLHRAGVSLRHPAAYVRHGIPGSGGPEWIKNNWEFIVCATKGRLPWADPTVCGHPPKYAPGGDCTNRRKNGKRVMTRSRRGSRDNGSYTPPKLANPGNWLEFPDEGVGVQCAVGKGHMGHALAHENEAPYPLRLAEFFVRSFCPPAGTALDCFAGSGTTGHACMLHGRNYIGIDIRPDQKQIAETRFADVGNR